MQGGVHDNKHPLYKVVLSSVVYHLEIDSVGCEVVECGVGLVECGVGLEGLGTGAVGWCLGDVLLHFVVYVVQEMSFVPAVLFPEPSLQLFSVLESLGYFTKYYPYTKFIT